MTVRWGFLGTGRIAATVAGDLARATGGSRYAVASRDAARAAAFADAHGFERGFASYDDLLADPDVDAVYVATPHGQHHRDVAACIDAGKAVLVEKAFTVSAASAADLVARARHAGVFCMEAMWTRHQPLMGRLREMVADGAIGDVRAVHADFGTVTPYDEANRVWAPALGGGALLDLGVYPVSFAQMLLGTPDSVAVHGSLAPSGVDAEAALLLGWTGGASALVSCSLLSPLAGSARVIGTSGRIDLEAPFHRTPSLTVHRPDAEPERLVQAYTGRGYVHQLEEVHRCLGAGLTESPVMPLADTLAVMQVLDRALEALGAHHADEGFTTPT